MKPEELIGRFVEHLARMQFERAREFAESEKLRTDWAAFSALDERHWPALMAVLAQLANLESMYFSLSYLLSKFSFRKESSIKDVYAQLRLELLRIAAAAEGSGNAEMPTKIGKMATELAQFTSARVELINFYTLLPTKDWRTFDEELAQPELQLLLDEPRCLLSQLCRNEVRVLQLLLKTQQALQACNSLEVLLNLKCSSELLEDWFHSLDASSVVKPSGPSFFLAFGSRRRSSISRLVLLQFLLQFHNTMVAKFSLYFHDTFIAFVPNNELKQAYTAPISFLQLFHTFYRKSNAHTVCLLLNRLDQDFPFRGFGYHYTSSAANEPPSSDAEANPSIATTSESESQSFTSDERAQETVDFKKDIKSGLSEKFPALVFIPADRRHDHSHYATICSFVQEGCGGSGSGVSGGTTVSSGSNANLSAEASAMGKIRYLYDRNKEQTFFTVCVEANIHLVVTFERRVQERESAVHAFFGEALSGLRCTKHFQGIRNMSK